MRQQTLIGHWCDCTELLQWVQEVSSADQDLEMMKNQLMAKIVQFYNIKDSPQ